MKMEREIVIFDVDGILLKKEPNAIFGTEPDQLYFEMAKEAMSVGLTVIVITGRTIVSAEAREMFAIFEAENFQPDAIIPYPGRWPGFEAYVDWKLGWIDFFHPLAVIDDMAIFTR